MHPRFGNIAYVRELKAVEGDRFLAARGSVAFKSAPWSDHQMRFGDVDTDEIRKSRTGGGNGFAVTVEGVEERYPDLDSFLDHWIGD